MHFSSSFPGAEIVENSSSGIPFPLIVFMLSTALSLLVTGSACCLRNYQKTQQKQSHSQNLKISSVRKLSAPSVSVGFGSGISGSSGSSSYQKSCSRAVAEQRQLLVVPTMQMNKMNSHRPIGNVNVSRINNMCQSNLIAEPTIEFALSRCSYCGDESSEISAVRTYEHCYNGSFISSTSHSLHCGHWT